MTLTDQRIAELERRHPEWGDIRELAAKVKAETRRIRSMLRLYVARTPRTRTNGVAANRLVRFGHWSHSIALVTRESEELR